MKYYAVRKGVKPGIYYTWEACESQVKGYSGSEFKKFSTLKEARAFIHSSKPVNTYKSKEKNNVVLVENDESVYLTFSTLNKAFAFVDGSYNKYTKTYGSGCILFYNKTKYMLQSSGNDSRLIQHHNITGELQGVLLALNFCKQNNIKEITIFYDCMGIEEWATGKWKRNCLLTQDYYKKVKEYSKEFRIQFKKVKAHSGNKLNNEVDKLAKFASGIL